MRYFKFLPANAATLYSTENIKLEIREDIKFFACGKDALLYFIKNNLCKNKKIIFPAYFCASTSNYIEKNGYKIKWIDINKDLEYDINKIEKILQFDKISAIVICNYFGWKSKQINQLLDLSKKFNVKCIIDSCHLPLESIKYKNDKVCVIGSLRKVYPLYDGGILNECRSDIYKNIKINNKFLKSLINRIINLLNSFQINIIILKTLIKKFKLNNQNYYLNKNLELLPNKFTLSLISSTEYQKKISLARRNNFKVLLEKINNPNVIVINKNIDCDDVPLNFPIFVNNAKKLIEYLHKNGIEAYIWLMNDMPFEVKKNENLYPISNVLSESIICLPLHQDLILNDLDYISKKINNWIH